MQRSFKIVLVIAVVIALGSATYFMFRRSPEKVSDISVTPAVPHSLPKSIPSNAANTSQTMTSSFEPLIWTKARFSDLNEKVATHPTSQEYRYVEEGYHVWCETYSDQSSCIHAQLKEDTATRAFLAGVSKTYEFGPSAFEQWALESDLLENGKSGVLSKEFNSRKVTMMVQDHGRMITFHVAPKK